MFRRKFKKSSRRFNPKFKHRRSKRIKKYGVSRGGIRL